MTLRLHDDEVDVRDDVVRALVDDHDPAWRGLPLRRVASTGTDNVVFRLGDDLGVRVPRIDWAVGQVEREARWLPLLAPHLPCAVPAPVAVGDPGHGYPHRWLVFRWLPGHDLARAAAPVAPTGAPRTPIRSEDWWAGVADGLGAVVRALHAVRLPDAPAAGPRGGPLAPHDDGVRRLVEEVAALPGERRLDAARATEVWEAALAAPPWGRDPVWVHGDLLPGNVLVADGPAGSGAVVGVIDWSAPGLGDPACDAMVAWSLPTTARRVFREAAGYDDATWARARGWVLQQTLAFIPYYRSTLPAAVEGAWQRLGAVLDEPAR
ncbi:aminoglycoside phosphotransferase family protein [Luteimicrobium sp. NPDC057192]|uniref:aminoglycoside phosphotransferase family protein n=1 Tax=Luteimicrobium sp. NPDC057192 TaxID=3346042 RepID=UPI00362EB560